MSKANGRKAIFITGAASGMGLETARLFAEKGWYVGGVDVNKDGLRALEQELGWDNCLVRELDVKKPPSISESIDWARTLLYLGHDSIDPQVIGDTLHVLLKYQTDIAKARKELVDTTSPTGRS